MDKKAVVSTSKFLSLILRHQPETIGIELDENGWVDVDELLDKAGKHGKSISRELLERVVRENDKQRFALSDDMSRIRANQGHSVQVDLELKPQTPPAELFHGTVARFVDSIRENGLVSGARQHVHLSFDRETATIVGSRRGKPVILVIDAQKMHEEGYKFYLSENGVWLADEVPARYIIA
jgi:putative RNA 2'-phosphotransferase